MKIFGAARRNTGMDCKEITDDMLDGRSSDRALLDHLQNAIGFLSLEMGGMARMQPCPLAKTGVASAV